MEFLRGIFIFCGCYVAVIVGSIVIHEAGHLVCGLASGYRFTSFRLFAWVWSIEDSRLTVRRSPNRLIAGQCLMEPPEDEAAFRFVLYNLGGGLANLVTGGIFLALIPFAQRGSIWLLPVVVFCCAFGLTNLIPMHLSVPNDGMNVYMALKSPDARHGLYLMLRVNAETARGKRYREYSEGDFSAPENADLTNYLTAFVLFCDASRLYDSGNIDESIAVYERLPLDKLGMYYRCSALMDCLYYYLVHRRNIEKARELYGRKGMAKFLRIGLPAATRTLAAYEWLVCGNPEKACTLLDKARAAAESYPNAGYAQSELEIIGKLEYAMRGKPAILPQ